MTGRRDKGGRDQRDERGREEAKPRMSTFFVPGTGIDREVITTDICRYLGNDALVKPGPYQDPRTGDVRQGYFVTAYRALTTEQLADLKADSLRWQQESQRNPLASRTPAGDGYRGSATRRQQWADPAPTYQGRDSLPQRAQPEPHYQPQYQGSGGMPPPNANYPRSQEYPVDTPNYSYDTRAPAMTPGMQVGNYAVHAPPTSRNPAQTDPRSTAYPTSYPLQDSQGGRGIGPQPGYPVSNYPSYADPGGLASPPGASAGRAQPGGMAYESSYGVQPGDPRYGRNAPGAQPGTEEGYDANEDYEDDSMEDAPQVNYPPQQPTRDVPRPRDGARERESPRETTSTKSGHRDRGERRR